ncbi:hypothetical protein K438DRAFT_1765295 [Mycena galopus ATCC 62051]|nr:hypothetical protein K438DRAFT_1765295 [Mycena galopus ATCC 62051]
MERSWKEVLTIIRKAKGMWRSVGQTSKRGRESVPRRQVALRKELGQFKRLKIRLAAITEILAQLRAQIDIGKSRRESKGESSDGQDRVGEGQIHLSSAPAGRHPRKTFCVLATAWTKRGGRHGSPSKLYKMCPLRGGDSAADCGGKQEEGEEAMLSAHVPLRPSSDNSQGQERGQAMGELESIEIVREMKNGDEFKPEAMRRWWWSTTN